MTNLISKTAHFDSEKEVQTELLESKVVSPTGAPPKADSSSRRRSWRLNSGRGRSKGWKKRTRNKADNLKFREKW